MASRMITSSSFSYEAEMPEVEKKQVAEPEDHTKPQCSPSKVQHKGEKRRSKRDIPVFNWTNEARKTVAEYIIEKPQLYDKKQKEWLNKAAKTRLWTQAGAQLDPPATGDQCKKMYENMRTRLGKILKKETKSGSGQASRTVRDEEIVSTWEFLKKHIVRGKTVASDKFDSPGTPESDRVYVVEEQGHDVSSEGSEDLPLLCEKGHVKKYKRPETLSTASRSTSGTRTPVSGPVIQSNLNEAFQQVLSKADTLGKTAALSGQRKIVNDFACLLECHMQKIPEEKWERFEIECLTLIHRFKQPSQYPRQKQQQQPVSWPQSPSQEWPPASRWSSYAQWPANQVSYSQLMPAAPSAVAVQGPSHEFHHPPTTATFRHSNEKLQEAE